MNQIKLNWKFIGIRLLGGIFFIWGCFSLVPVFNSDIAGIMAGADVSLYIQPDKVTRIMNTLVYVPFLSALLYIAVHFLDTVKLRTSKGFWLSITIMVIVLLFGQRFFLSATVTKFLMKFGVLFSGAVNTVYLINSIAFFLLSAILFVLAKRFLMKWDY